MLYENLETNNAEIKGLNIIDNCIDFIIKAILYLQDLEKKLMPKLKFRLHRHRRDGRKTIVSLSLPIRRCYWHCSVIHDALFTYTYI